MRILFKQAFVFIAMSCLGCGSGGPALYSVTGKVTLDGQPLPNVNVAFFPSDQKLPSSGGIADSQGVYRLTTAQGLSGAVAGKHKITVYGGQQGGPTARPEELYKNAGSKMDANGKPVGPKFENPVPEKYALPDKSNLEKDVAAKANVIDLELSSK